MEVKISYLENLQLMPKTEIENIPNMLIKIVEELVKLNTHFKETSEKEASKKETKEKKDEHNLQKE